MAKIFLKLKIFYSNKGINRQKIKRKMKEEEKRIYTCRYCGKHIVSFSCSCENSKNSHIWKARKKQKEKKVKEE